MFAERIGPSQLAEMSGQGTRLTSRLRSGDLPRTAADLAPGGAEHCLEAAVGIAAGPESYPVVQIEVHGVLPLVCQRCLGPVDWLVDVDVALTAVPDEAAMQQLADPFDSILLDDEGGLCLLAAVEDEILAALPLAPLHADECRAGMAVETAPARNVQRPFAALGALMSGRNPESGQD